jgi:hypothetical protein
MGTYWEPKINEKKILPPPPPALNLKGKKASHLECLHWLHEISLPQKSWSPFLAWANSLCKQHPTYLFYHELNTKEKKIQIMEASSLFYFFQILGISI